MITASEAYTKVAEGRDTEAFRTIIEERIVHGVARKELQAEFTRVMFLRSDFDFLHELKFQVTSDAACIYVSWADPKA